MNTGSIYIGALVAAGLFCVLSGCDSVDSDELQSDVVVEMILIADEGLPSLRLSRTIEVNETYDFSASAISNAKVRLSLRGSSIDPIAFRERPNHPGVYAAIKEHIVQPGGTYDLSVIIPGEVAPVTSSTTVPRDFDILSASLDTAVYQSEEQLQFTITPSRIPGRTLDYYVFVTEALDVREEQLVPFSAADDDISLDDLRVSGSPIISEGNFDVNRDGTITIQYPWLAIAFYGPNRLRLNAIDDNLYDFIRSQSVQQGGSTFGPGEIPNPIENLNGAHGIFGSLIRKTHILVVLRPA